MIISTKRLKIINILWKHYRSFVYICMGSNLHLQVSSADGFLMTLKEYSKSFRAQCLLVTKITQKVIKILFSSGDILRL